MKRIFSFIALLCLLLNAIAASAQLLSGDLRDSTLPRGQFGIRAGANMANISGNTWDNSYTTGFTGGIWARMHKNRLGARAELSVSTYRINAASFDSGGHQYYAVSDSQGNRGSFRATTLDIPVMLEITIVQGLLLQAGVQYSNLLSLSNITAINGNYKDLFKQGEFSGVAGLEVSLPWNLSVGGRYRLGFSSIDNTAVSGITDAWRTTAIQLYACYRLAGAK